MAAPAPARNDLPKVATDLKPQLEGFNIENLEKQVIPRRKSYSIQLKKRSVRSLLTKSSSFGAGLDNAKSILSEPRITFNSLNISAEDVERILLKAAESFCLKTYTVKDLLRTKSSNWRQISFRCESLDAALKGGIYTRGITEIYGESGVGKTQLLLQLCLSVQLPLEIGGLGKGAVFICTEDVFPTKRLYQLIGAFQRKFVDKPDYAQNIFVEHIIEMGDLLECISTRLPRLIAAKRIGLIVIDSIAGAFRVESDYIARAYAMRRLAKTLLLLSEEHHCAIVCANQVTSSLAPEYNGISPSLGLAWANLIRVRARVSKTQRQVSEQVGTEAYVSAVRRMEICFSPDVKRNCGCFTILTEDGIGESTLT